MRARSWLIGLVLYFGSALSASAQFSQISPTNTTGTSAPSYFTTPFAKQDLSGFSQKPNVPGPMNLVNMMPSWSSLQNTIMGRSSSAPQVTTMRQRSQTTTTTPSANGRYGRPGFGNGGGFGSIPGGNGARPTYSGFFP